MKAVLVLTALLLVGCGHPHYRDDFAARTTCTDANARQYAKALDPSNHQTLVDPVTHKIRSFEYTDSCEKRAEELGLRPRW